MSLDRAAAAVAGGGVVAFTGAGISAESGIPTFRDRGGLWDRFGAERFGTLEGLAEAAMLHPDRLAGFLIELRRAVASANPNPAHAALAELERLGHLIGVVTQNTDGLHAAAGSRHVIELHGSFLRRVCLPGGHLEEVTREAFAAGLDRAVAGLRSAFVPSFASLLPRCPACGGPSRPDVVTFGESVRSFPEAEALVGAARVLLVVGTQGEVEPAASLPRLARSGGAVVIEVGPTPTEVRPDVEVRGQAGQVLPALLGAVRGRLEPPETGVLESGGAAASAGWPGGH
jgi:NAD-dependent deacetylase